MAVAKVDLGTKRVCPKCGARFYDLGNDDPVTCIACEETFVPEVLLKPRRPAPTAEKPAPAKADTGDASDSDDAEDIDDDLLDIDEDSDDEDIESILETDDDSIEDEIVSEVVIDTDVDDDSK